MIVRRLLVIGMIAGVVAGLLAALFARAIVEPSIDGAMTFEAARNAAHGVAEEPEVFSRSVQKGAGLLVAATVYGAAIGGVFALVFAGVHRRVLHLEARASAAWLAVAAFTVISLVPAFKYPPNPPAVGSADTIGLRTATFFVMIAISVIAAAAAVQLAGRLRQRLGGFDAGLAAVAAAIVLVTIGAALLPAIDEVPPGFPASLLWTFRLGSLATQAILWAGIGLLFGHMADRALRAG